MILMNCICQDYIQFSLRRFEHLVKDEKFPEDSFENVESDVVKLTCDALSKIGFNNCNFMIEDSIKPIQITDRVCEHALLRM